MSTHGGLRSFMVAISRDALNHNGFDGFDGTYVEHSCWDEGSRSEVRKVDTQVIEEFAALPGPAGLLDGHWPTWEPVSLVTEYNFPPFLPLVLMM